MYIYKVLAAAAQRFNLYQYVALCCSAFQTLCRSVLQCAGFTACEYQMKSCEDFANVSVIRVISVISVIRCVLGVIPIVAVILRALWCVAIWFSQMWSVV